MKTLILLLLALPLSGAPVWINRGESVPHGLVRFKLNSPTQSMAPVMTGREVCYFEPYNGQPVLVGDFVWFAHPTLGNVLHEVAAKNKRAVLTSGRANKHSDGWQPNNRIRYILRFIERPSVSHLSQVR
jgi:hypothetical protein